MSARKRRRAQRTLKERQKNYDQLRENRGYNRPGSLNVHKTFGGGGRGTTRRKR
jgi:hypothetical protein